MQPAETAIAAALAGHLPVDEEELLELLETPPSPEMGDYALPCFTLAGRLKQPPQQIAAGLAEEVGLPDDVREVRAEGPYLNFFLDRPRTAERVLRRIRAKADAYGSAELGRGKTVLLDYSSPNIAKHLGVHHLPGTLLGDSLRRIYSALGYETVAINFLGDWGSGFGKLIAAVERYDIEQPESLTVSDLQKLYVRYSREADEDERLQDAAREAARRLEEGEPEALRCWRAFRSISLAEFQRIYQLLDVHFDRVSGESEYAEAVPQTIERLQETGVAHQSEGALVVEFGEEMPPLMVRRSDGASLYATRDLAAALDRWGQHHFDRALYVIGNEQALHIGQLRAALRQMGCDWADRMVHVNFGLIKFRDEETGEARVGSTRSGQMLLLEEVLDEALARAARKVRENAGRFEPGTDLDELATTIGLGAVRFRQLSTRRTRDTVFDWDRMLDFEGDTGPYVMYAHARMCSILRKAGQDVTEDVDFSRLELPEEWALVRHLEQFPRAVRRAAEQYEPSAVASHLLDLCADFSTYYSAGMSEPARRVLCDDDRLRAARLLLVDATRHVIRNGLDLLGVSAPERM
ncbi:MAG: arginine--tRNA ligase [Candidatus Brocadiia bacterium]